MRKIQCRGEDGHPRSPLSHGDGNVRRGNCGCAGDDAMKQTVQLFLREAYLCGDLDCNTISNDSRACPRCHSQVMSVAGIIERKPAPESSPSLSLLRPMMGEWPSTWRNTMSPPLSGPAANHPPLPERDLKQSATADRYLRGTRSSWNRLPPSSKKTATSAPPPRKRSFLDGLRGWLGR